MIVFWIAAALLSAATVALVAYFAGREPQGAGADPSAVVYRRQLDEIDEMAARGLLEEDERKDARAEAGRRLLGAGELVAENAPTRRAKQIIIGASVLSALAAMGVYFLIGAPGRPDMPFKRRAAEWTKMAETDPGQMDAERLAVVLKDVVAKRPNEPQPLYFLALSQLRSGQVQLSIHNLRKVAKMAPDQPEVWGTLGEALTAAQNDGSVPAEAVQAFNKAIALDPKALKPRFFLAKARIDGGDKAGGLADWRTLLAEQQPGSPEAGAIQEEIARVEGGGTRIAKADPQSEMIQGMVAGLAEKLKQNPNDSAGWARLVRSYAVLGDTAKMNAALEEARRIFKDKPSERAAIEAAADKPQ